VALKIYGCQIKSPGGDEDTLERGPQKRTEIVDTAQSLAYGDRKAILTPTLVMMGGSI
jgi:hypothetical protein